MGRALGLILLMALGGCSPAAVVSGGDLGRAPDGGAPGDLGFAFQPTTTVAAETANNTSASGLFTDRYHNYATQYAPGNQTGGANGDARPGSVSRLAVSSLAAGTPVLAETQTWFCHRVSNEAGGALVDDAKCGSHLDVGYNSDSPAHVARAVDDLTARGVAGVIMDWSGKDSTHDADATFYPTATMSSPPPDGARESTEVCTNAIFAMRAEAEKRSGFRFAVMEDEGIKNCTKGWAGGCACWAAYGATCNATSQVISDLHYIDSKWTGSPAYLRVGGKPVVFFFDPDYSGVIDWNAVHQYAPNNQTWIFYQTGGYSHAFSGGAISWLGTAAYPAGDPSFGADYLNFYDGFVTTPGKVAAGQLVVGSAFKGFNDAFVNGWNFASGVNDTRYINQRCGLTWLATFAKNAAFFDSAGKPTLPYLQLVTWDDYEEGTELETGIDTCLTDLQPALAGTILTWAPRFAASLTDPAILGSEATIDHYVVYVSLDTDGSRLMPLGAATTQHQLDLQPFGLPQGGSCSLRVQAIGKPFLTNTLSPPVACP